MIIDPKSVLQSRCAMILYRPEAIEDILYIQPQISAYQAAYNLLPRHDPKLPSLHHYRTTADADRRFAALRRDRTISPWKVLDNSPRCRCHDLRRTGSLLARFLLVPEKSRRCTPRCEACSTKCTSRLWSLEFSGTKSICCGIFFFPRPLREEFNAFQKKRAAQMPCQETLRLLRFPA